jgi:hypothetical protein
VSASRSLAGQSGASVAARAAASVPLLGASKGFALPIACACILPVPLFTRAAPTSAEERQLSGKTERRSQSRNERGVDSSNHGERFVKNRLSGSRRRIASACLARVGSCVAVFRGFKVDGSAGRRPSQAQTAFRKPGGNAGGWRLAG